MNKHANTWDVEALAKEAAGNWRGFDSFGWWDQPDDPEDWCIVYTVNRDSGLLDQSNAAAIEKALVPFTADDPPTVIPQRHSHWACGWVDGYVIRVYGPDRRVTEAFQTWCLLQEWIRDYPLLDEKDYGNREYEAAIENIRFEGYDRDHEPVGELPEDWPAAVYSWLSEHNDREAENRDDLGAYPSQEAITEAMVALGLIRDADGEGPDHA